MKPQIVYANILGRTMRCEVIKTMKQPSQYRLEYACQLHNHHTSPSAMRSDFEHTIHRKAARKIHRWLRHNFSGLAWKETDSGRFVAL